MLEKRIKIFSLTDNEISKSYFINNINQKKSSIIKKYVIKIFNVKLNLIKGSLNYLK